MVRCVVGVWCDVCMVLWCRVWCCGVKMWCCSVRV